MRLTNLLAGNISIGFVTITRSAGAVTKRHYLLYCVLNKENLKPGLAEVWDRVSSEVRRLERIG